MMELLRLTWKLKSADGCFQLYEEGQGVSHSHEVSGVEERGRLPQLVHAQCKQEDAWTR